MNKVRRIGIVLALSAFVLSCADAPTTPVELSSGPELGVTDGPANPGNSGVERFPDWLWSWTSDPIGGAGSGSDLRAYQWLANDAVSCGGESDVILWESQVNKKGNVVAHLRGTPVVIYRDSEVGALCPNEPTDPEDPDYPPSAECCAHLTNEWLYMGTHDATTTLSKWYGDGPGAWVFQYMGHGIVYDRAGTAYRYRDKQKLLIDPNWNFRITHEYVVLR